ncbi:DUF3348 family protein [Pseudoxanthomonas winnipegensis]|uniref:DUF3348 family protein n=1 Tax=Pseudoxanthomonas winnipegensis TaxID=2480810 RepID=A0A4Q8LSI4_9GAMM|nr:DUF3348 family protein [Pseudoxanthomonas winnipegensis]RZZ84854.1 DUF3348 family protein [Pseudoxanthomonas winnipegensis]TAA33796.1 DUF3348 family protein [Pseudoxanthomonas winnipegensis]
MAKPRQHGPVPGPAFVRLLARLGQVAVPAPPPALPERLAQWVDWNRAVALSRALDGAPPTAAEGPRFDAAEADACHAQRAALAAAIREDRELAAAIQRRLDKAAGEGTNLNLAVDFAVFRQRYLAHQRAMLATTGLLRGRLRDMLGHGPAALARLAEVDAVMESTLSPREQTALAAAPALLEQHFLRLRPAEADAVPASAPPTDAGQMPAWLQTFAQDMQRALLAELDLRFQPIDALLAALTPSLMPSCQEPS